MLPHGMAGLPLPGIARCVGRKFCQQNVATLIRMPTLGHINKSVIGMSPTEFVIATAAASFISRHSLSSLLRSLGSQGRVFRGLCELHRQYELKGSFTALFGHEKEVLVIK